jgi:hypothetical protein
LLGFGVEDGGTLHLTNPSAFSGTAEIFALLGVDPDEEEHPDGYDIEYVGVRRGWGEGAAGPTIEFGVKTFGPRTVALDSTFEIGIDYNRDGVYDYVAFNADRLWRSGEGTVGQNYTYIIDLATYSLTGPYYPTTFTANSSNAVLRLNAADLGITSETQPFDFYVLTYRNADLQRWDVAPDSGVYTYTVRDARFRTDRADGRVTLGAGTTATVGVYANARGFLDGESAERFAQQGILLLYTQNAPAADEADIVTVGFPFRYRVELQTLRFNPNLSGYVASRGIGPGGPGVNFGVGDLWTGVDNRAINPLIYHGIVHFELGATGGVVEIEDAVLELTGLDARYMDRRYYGRWGVDMLTAEIDANLDKLNYFGIAQAATEARLAPVVDDGALAAGRTVAFVLDAAARAKLEAHTRTSGRVTFRTFEEPLYAQGLQLFAWDGRPQGEGAKPPVLHIVNVTHLP